MNFPILGIYCELSGVGKVCPGKTWQDLTGKDSPILVNINVRLNVNFLTAIIYIYSG